MNQEQQQHYFENQLQFNSYLATPDSSRAFPELNKDLSTSNLSSAMQRVVLIKGRTAHYLDVGFKELSELLNLEFTPTSSLSFKRDIMSIGVTAQGVNKALLNAITQSIQKVQHSYSMDKEYKKNIGG